MKKKEVLNEDEKKVVNNLIRACEAILPTLSEYHSQVQRELKLALLHVRCMMQKEKT